MMTRLLITALLFTGCVDDEQPEPEKLPTCAEIGAPADLLCTATGLCTWEGMECCSVPASGFQQPDPRCVGDEP